MTRSYSGMANEAESGSFGWCNLFVKFFLVISNIIIWLLGAVLLAAGIFIQVGTDSDERISGLGLDSFTTILAVALIVIGIFLFLLGLCGSVGALFEIFFLLIIYSVVLTVIVLAEVAVVVWVYLDRNDLYDRVERTLQRNVVNYFDDINLRDIIDFLHQIIGCCGISAPNDWELNIYFNCSSIAFQRCSVPFSCCLLEDGDVINVQCGYRTLDIDSTRYLSGIHDRGCLTRLRDDIFESNTFRLVIAIVGGILLVFQVVNVMLAISLAVDVSREKKAIKAIKNRQKQQQQY